MKTSLELRLALPTTIVILLLIIVSIFSDVFLQRKQAEETLFEQAYILSQEMQSVWDFVSVNQDLINTDGDGTYTFKGLHCSIVGTSVGALFTNRTNYVIRYASDNPRNTKNSPDDFEFEAIQHFRNDANLGEFDSFGSMEDGTDYYRYSAPLRMKSACASCHGEPAGEIDITGYPREGLKSGDLVGIVSISIPIQAFEDNLRDQILQRGLLSILVLAAGLLTVILVTKRYVISPIRGIATAVNKIGSGDLSTRIDADSIKARGEMLDLAVHFNDMTDELHTLQKDLEQLVQVRTEQLADANRMLTDQAHELEDMYERLQADDLYKSHFFTMMSHELRTPITAIRAYIDMLEHPDELDDNARENAVHAIQTNIHTLSKLVDNILDSAKMEAGAIKIERDVIDATDIMNELAKTLKPLALDKDIELRILPCEDMPLFLADEEKLLHILENLGSNAIKYTNRNGQVTVKTYLHDEDNTVRFEVIDNGIGIPEKDRRLVFEKFVQGGNSVLRPVSGSGLGLALAKEYAELQGGGILLDSELGKGSTFTVYIPFEAPDFELE